MFSNKWTRIGAASLCLSVSSVNSLSAHDDDKSHSHAGRIRVPCIARWPEKILTGRDEHGMWSTVDLLPTFAKLAGVPLPAGDTLDGRDASNILFGSAVQETQPPVARADSHRVRQHRRMAEAYSLILS